jgi:hypothetical protein
MMARIEAATAEEYLQQLPDDRRAVLSAVREVILRSLPAGYAESVGYGMITYEIPLERFPKTYNKQPLSYAALAAQKNHYALYLMGAYGDPAHARWIEEEFARAGKKLDMGKSCLRFRRLEDLPLDTVAQSIARVPPEELIAMHEAAHGGSASR